MRIRTILALLLSASLVVPVEAADAPGGWAKFSRVWRPSSVPAPNWNSTSRYADLLKAGQLYLSLRDAIAIAIENNLDVEMQRYNLLAARQDLLRAQGGGTTRGLQYSVTEVPLGIGGPASPLLTVSALRLRAGTAFRRTLRSWAFSAARNRTSRFSARTR
jgi:outer membrane protein